AGESKDHEEVVAMGGRRVNHLLLRHFLPLIAVAVLVGPSTALAAGLGPDQAPGGGPVGGGGLTPDPAPAAPRTPSAPAVDSRPVSVAPVAAPVFPRTVEAPPVPRRVRTTRKHVRRGAARRPVARPVRIIDVMPLRVDVHRGLGAVPGPLLDDSKLALAALALFAAAAAAASGAVLASRGREPL
ncbi:MAG: hypothetical protein ACRDM1_05140, partial [Gaiellaceae bacterium]